MTEDVSLIKGKERRLLAKSTADDLEQIMFERGEYEKDGLCEGFSREEFTQLLERILQKGSIYALESLKDYLKNELFAMSPNDETREKIEKTFKNLELLKRAFCLTKEKYDDYIAYIASFKIAEEKAKDLKEHIEKFEARMEELREQYRRNNEENLRRIARESKEETKEDFDSDEKTKKKRDRDYDR